jgi:hypothetical protein
MVQYNHIDFLADLQKSEVQGIDITKEAFLSLFVYELSQCIDIGCAGGEYGKGCMVTFDETDEFVFFVVSHRGN